MTDQLPDDALENAAAAVAFAQLVRKRHAQKTTPGTRQRNADIRTATKRLHEAMAPLKSEIGRFPYGAVNATAEAKRTEIREASLAIQKERRKLWKMMPKKVVRNA